MAVLTFSSSFDGMHFYGSENHQENGQNNLIDFLISSRSRIIMIVKLLW